MYSLKILTQLTLEAKGHQKMTFTSKTPEGTSINLNTKSLSLGFILCKIQYLFTRSIIVDNLFSFCL